MQRLTRGNLTASIFYIRVFLCVFIEQVIDEPNDLPTVECKEPAPSQNKEVEPVAPKDPATIAEEEKLAKALSAKRTSLEVSNQ